MIDLKLGRYNKSELEALAFGLKTAKDIAENSAALRCEFGCKNCAYEHLCADIERAEEPLNSKIMEKAK